MDHRIEIDVRECIEVAQRVMGQVLSLESTSEAEIHWAQLSDVQREQAIQLMQAFTVVTAHLWGARGLAPVHPAALLPALFVALSDEINRIGALNGNG